MLTTIGRIHFPDLPQMPGARRANARVRAPSAKSESQVVTSFRSNPKCPLLRVLQALEIQAPSSPAYSLVK